jgi:hypothetical protein
MRFVPQNEFYDSYELPVSRIHWAAYGAQKGAAKVGASPPLVKSIEELVQMCLAYAVGRRAWSAEINNEANPQLKKSDYSVDRSFSNFVTRVELEAEDFGPETPRGKAARKLLAGPLNVEVFAVTNATREEEASMLGVIVEEVDTDYFDEVRTCGLEEHFAMLHTDLDTFVTEMHQNPDDAPAPTTDQLEAQAERIRSKMIEVIHRANGAWPTTSEHDGINRSHVLGPFAVQNDRAGAYYRRNNGSTLPDIDPETGENIVVEPAAPVLAKSDLSEVEPA